MKLNISGDFVLRGIGLRAGGDDLTTLHLLYARITQDGMLDLNDTLVDKKRHTTGSRSRGMV